MKPMMPYDMGRFDCPNMVPPPMFHFQLPHMGMPGIPIPPPPAPPHMMQEADEYQIEMAAMANEMMQQGMFVQPPVVAPYAPPNPPLPPPLPSPNLEEVDDVEPPEICDSYLAAEIASVVHTLTSSQLTYALSAFKIFLDKSPVNAKRLLVNNPQMVYALIHAQYVLGNTEESLLPLTASDKHLARLNRRDRKSMFNTAKDTAEFASDSDSRAQSARGRRGIGMEATDDSMNVHRIEHARPEPPRVDSGKSSVSSRRRDTKVKDVSVSSSRKGGRGFKDGDMRGTMHGESRVPASDGMLQTHSPHIKGSVQSVPHGDPYKNYIVPPPYQPPPQPPQPPLPAVPMPPVPSPPMHTSPAQPVPAPPAPGYTTQLQSTDVAQDPSNAARVEKAIEEMLKEVQPAPQALVDEVLKHTEILTNIQRASLFEMQSWPPEQRLQSNYNAATMEKIDVFPTTDSPAVAVELSVSETADAPSAVSIKGLEGPVEVFHFAFAANTAPKSKSSGFDAAKFEQFPSKFVTSDSGVLAVTGFSEFSGNLGDVVEYFATLEDGCLLAEAVVGCGKRCDFQTSDAYTLSKTLAKTASHHNCKSVVFSVGDLDAGFVELLVIGFLNYITLDRRFKKDSETDYKLTAVQVISTSISDAAAFSERCKTFAIAMHTTRELVTAPANYANTVSVANYISKKFGALNLDVKMLSESDCRAMGMGSYCAVAQGSQYPPIFLHATYRGEGPVKAKVALVGKGIMFDSGGLNIKSASSEIELMKTDMGGMSAVFGAAEAIAALKPRGVEVHFISATCENMAGSKAYRPGDVVTASNGKTIEVINTDAEGRLTLADALVYAERLGVDYIVDVATLTGACVIALGFQYGGYFANDEGFNARFVKALQHSGELAWRLPLAKEYTEGLKSKVADLSNCNYTSKGQTVMAALFLKEFVESAKWIHWDIAGTAFEKGTGRGTAYGVRTMVNLVLDLAEQ
ncbi:putative cytosol aminopeptidase [Babesia sp. Xinjiang]|uniref:putative cytosol aminopeptidase n=1 Tax=Babesia sp. Xinjiang TaxID=462227 RepID=UPI000A230B13|nr:putative cytosol aminopeptidase [Babesia sp. Xinjiang]ORM40817.1 putative cytosol aminopeptidase [Babesia sp. Xinjiang]